MCVDRILAVSQIVLKILVVYAGPSRRLARKKFEIRHSPFQILIHGYLCTTRRDTVLASKVTFNKTQMHKFTESKPWEILDVNT
jgi:hypothetical protein